MEKHLVEKPEGRDKTLILLVGLPRCGKSTLAARLSVDLNCPIVCPDQIRLAIHGKAFDRESESLVWYTTRIMVKSLFGAGHDKIILDATGITRKSRDAWKCNQWAREFIEFDTPKEECIKRAKKMKREDLVEVIERMAGQYEPVSEEELGD